MNAPPDRDELQALLEAGRRAVVVVPSAARVRLEDRLGKLAGWTPTGGGSSGPSAQGSTASSAGAVTAAARGLRLLKGALIFLVGTGAGLVAKDRVLPTPPKIETRIVERVVEVERPSASPEPAVTSAPAAPLVSSRQASPALAAALSPSTRTSPATDAALERERTMIETARTALVRGDAPGALAVLMQHASAFPSGKLAELREVLTVQALARSGRSAEANARAGAFRRRYPQSVYFPTLDEALGTISP